jgi:hypothetical protein
MAQIPLLELAARDCAMENISAFVAEQQTPNNKQKIDNRKLRTYNSQPGTDKNFYIKFSIINHPYF